MLRVTIHDGKTAKTFDISEFEEGKHPRDPDGKFASGAYAGGKGPAYTHPGIHKTLTEGGYEKKKNKSTSEMTATYVHPSGHKVSVHYPKGESPSATGFTSHPVAGLKSLKKGEGGKELAAYLKTLAGRHESAAPVASGGASAAASLIGKGYKFAKPPSSEGPLLLQKGKSLVSIENGKWVASAKGHLPKKGEGVESLNALLDGKPMTGGVHWENVSNMELSPEHTVNTNSGDFDPEAHAKEVASYAEHQEKIKAAQAAQKEAEEKANESIKEIPTASHAPEKLKAIINSPGGETYAKVAKQTPVPTDVEQKAVSTYTGNAYGPINRCLRHGENCSGYASAIAGTSKYLEKSKLPAVTLHRGIKGDYAKIIKSIAFNGATFQEKGFMSTSVNPAFAKSWAGGGGDFITMDIEVPEGTPGAAVTHLGGAGAQEAEVLVQKDRILKVVHWDPVKSHMKVQLINPD